MQPPDFLLPVHIFAATEMKCSIYGDELLKFQLLGDKKESTLFGFNWFECSVLCP